MGRATVASQTRMLCWGGVQQHLFSCVSLAGWCEYGHPNGLFCPRECRHSSCWTAPTATLKLVQLRQLHFHTHPWPHTDSVRNEKSAQYTVKAGRACAPVDCTALAGCQPLPHARMLSSLAPKVPGDAVNLVDNDCVQAP
jgi:hypothetical protein